MAGYQTLDILLKEELDQLEEEGRVFDRGEFLQRIEAKKGDHDALMEIYKTLCALPVRPDFPYEEPSEYADIQALCTLGNKPQSVDADALYDKTYGAWLGRCAGCAFGQPVELWARKDIQNWCEKANAWPLDHFLPAHSEAEKDGVHLNNTYSTRENLQHMPTDDDIRYTVLALETLEEKQGDFDSWDAGKAWIYKLPFRQLCTAENQAYLNFINIDENGPWGKPEGAMELLRKNRVNFYLNPYREWIGAQIRIDAYGYACAGDPHRAALFAWRDAYFSHMKNGIYGAMFFAALIAAAYTAQTVEEAVAQAMREIPTTSRFYEMAENAIRIAKEAENEDALLTAILAAYAPYNVVHTINNSALCIASILYSKGDFHKALTLSVMGGMDADCNGATVGSVMGAFCGEKALPQRWKAPLHDTLYSGLAGTHPIAISVLAERTCKVHESLYKA